MDSTEAANGGGAQNNQEEASPWEGMVRIALMRMMADEEREAPQSAACLTKFAELLLLNGVITTEQMWAAFNLVGDMYHTSGAAFFAPPCLHQDTLLQEDRNWCVPWLPRLRCSRAALKRPTAEGQRPRPQVCAG